MAKESNPLIFIKARIFIVVQKLLINSTNQFYEITDETIGFNANREIMIGGKIRTIRKSIACNNRWLSENYYTAIKELDDVVRRIENENNYRRQIIDTQTTAIEKTIYVTANFKSSPVSITCPFCRKAITTRTESKFNLVAFFCCLMFNILYCCVQIC